MERLVVVVIFLGSSKYGYKREKGGGVTEKVES